MSFFTKPRLACYLALGVIAVVWLLTCSADPQLDRVHLYFPQHDNKTGVEKRCIALTSKQERVVSLVNELLLGPMDHRFLRLADPSVRPRSCFVRGSECYIDFPARILTPRSRTPDWRTVFSLFRKNIMMNCKNIDTVYFYIDGTPSYDGSGAGECAGG